MITRLYKILFALLLLVMIFPQAIAAGYVYHQPAPDVSFKRWQIPLPYFSAVDVSGNFQVNIEGHRHPPCVTLAGAANAVNAVSARVVNGRLVIRQIITNKQQTLGRVAITINLPGDLTALIVGGSTVVSGHNITSQGLNVVLNEQSSIYLDGEMRIRHLQNNSSGSVKIFWVNNGDLLIDGTGSGSIYLAGTADVFTVHLAGTSKLDAQDLRAGEVYVTTKDYACAKVMPLHSLYAFASDHGNIYYYNRPHLMAGYTRCSGNVLYIR